MCVLLIGGVCMCLPSDLITHSMLRLPDFDIENLVYHYLLKDNIPLLFKKLNYFFIRGNMINNMNSQRNSSRSSRSKFVNY